MFLQLLLKAISGAATEELIMLLEKFRQLNGDEDYNTLVEGLRDNFTLLAKVAAQTNTKIDDTLIGIILNALNEAPKSGL